MGTLPAPLSTIPPNAVDLNFPPPQYSNIFAQTVGNAATETDGWDSIFADASQVLQTFPDYLNSLDLPLSLLDSVFGEIDQIWEQSFADSLSSAITNGQADFDKYNVGLAAPTPPTTGSGGGGGGTPTGGGGAPAVGCGSHGGSKLGTYDPNVTDLVVALNRVSIADGKCTQTFVLEGVNLGPPTQVFKSIKLTSGDASLFAFSGGHYAATKEKYQDYWAVTLSPTKVGHFDAKALLITTSPDQQQRVFLSVDVIA